MSLPALAGFSAFVAVGLLTFPVRRLAAAFGVVDRPNERSSHHVPTARAGGLAIVLGASAVALGLATLDGELAAAALCVAAVAAVSLLDDVSSLPFWARLLVQTAAAVAVGSQLPLGSIGLPGWDPRSLSVPAGQALAVLFLVGYCNVFNFMDGINGLAAGQAALTAATLAILLYQGGCETAAVVAAAVCGAAAGFLPHNYPSARIFMGDVGSVTLGFVLAALSLTACARAGVPWTAVVLIHGVFLYDATTTLVKRALRRENLVKPHREHIYQILVLRGWSHRTVSLAYWLLSTWCCLAGYVDARSCPGLRWAAYATTGGLLVALSVAGRRRDGVAAIGGAR